MFKSLRSVYQDFVAYIHLFLQFHLQHRPFKSFADAVLLISFFLMLNFLYNLIFYLYAHIYDIIFATDLCYWTSRAYERSFISWNIKIIILYV